MANEGRMEKPPSAGKVLALTLGGFVVATLVVLGGIMPAEFNQDPLGLGRLTGISRLWAPPEVVLDVAASAVPATHEYETAFRTDTIEIPLTGGDDRRRGNELEYKVRTKKGATVIYSWTVEGITNPEEFYTEFHGHTLAENAEAMTVAFYKKATGSTANGTLIAPFDGVHGWYLQNQSVGPVVVRLKVSGFYELIPCCEAGNEAGIIANVPAAEAFGPPPE